MLFAKRKNLVRQGKRNATRELTETEEDALFEIGEFGDQDPKTLKIFSFSHFWPEGSK